MYAQYNAVLRGSAAAGSTAYSATLHLITSALRKLSRIALPPPGGVVYRGNGNMALPADFFAKDAQGCAGGVECAFMSTTPDINVALGYAGLHEGKELPTLFEIKVDKTSVGGDLTDFSQFEKEKELLYAALANLEIIGEPRLEEHEGKKLSVLEIRLTVNQRSKTVEAAMRARLDFLVKQASSMWWDVRHFAKKWGVLETLAREIQDMQVVLNSTATAADAAALNDNLEFGDAFERLIDAAEEQRVGMSESLWKRGEEARVNGAREEAAGMFECAIAARGPDLCARSKENSDRVLAWRRELMEWRGGGEGGEAGGGDDREQRAKDKSNLASDLDDQGEYEEALTLYHQALELYTEV